MYPPRLSQEGKLELTKAPRSQTVAARIPEGFRPAKPERIALGGPFAKREGIPPLPLFLR